MSITQIPPVQPAGKRRPDRGELYEPRSWESAYRGVYEAPALLVQLQDDLSRARRREAFWISVVVHLIVVLIIVNSDRLARFMPRRAGVVAVPALKNDKDFTFLELPPDQQKVAKRPDTKILSDKDRIASSKSPQLDREELKKILEAARAGRPGPTAPPTQQQQPSPGAQAAQNPAAEQPQGQQPAAPPPAPPSNEVAKLQQPSAAAHNQFSTGARLSPGAAISQAARASAASRGGFSGDNGDYGLGRGKKPTAAMGPLEVLSDTMGVDFGPYLRRVIDVVTTNWYALVPESARGPNPKTGKLTIEFAIMKDGGVQGMRYDLSSGDSALDRAAYGGITSSNPFPPLPDEFGGQYLGLRFTFCYNLNVCDIR